MTELKTLLKKYRKQMKKLARGNVYASAYDGYSRHENADKLLLKVLSVVTKGLGKSASDSGVKEVKKEVKAIMKYYKEI
jgi:hypothetical protein